MKLKVLVDNNTFIDQYYYGEPAVSYYIEDEDIRLLFDVGYSGLFLKNAAAFSIDLDAIDGIVISHGHDDHTGGLKSFFEQAYSKPIFVWAHPDAFREKSLGDLKICSPMLEEELKNKCKLMLSKEPVQISKHLTFLGEIAQIFDFENRKPIGRQTTGEFSYDDYVLDDTALAYQSDKGLYIITGCSHSGICNIIETAKRVCKEERVVGIIGGFHLFEESEQVINTIDYLKQNNITRLYPCHCTSFEVKAKIHLSIPVSEVGVGLELNW